MLTKRMKICIAAVVALLILLAGILVFRSLYPATPTKTVPFSLNNLKPERRFIILTVMNLSIAYQQWDSYNRTSYQYLMEHWNTYTERIKDDIKAMYSSRGADIKDLSIVHIDNNRTIEIHFVVDNKVSSDDEITADFLWFLDAWNLDFIDNGFQETNHGLVWSGNLGGVLTSITVNVPPQPAPYKAWGSPYGHCHGHIWWSRK